eukprot:358965-Prymnesium_polylepis.1
MAALREVATVLGWTFANVIGFVSARTVRLVQVEAHRVVGLVETAPAARSSTVALFTDSIQPTGHLSYTCSGTCGPVRLRCTAAASCMCARIASRSSAGVRTVRYPPGADDGADANCGTGCVDGGGSCGAVGRLGGAARS